MREGWRHTELGEHIDLLTGHPFKSAEYSEDGDGVRLLRGDNVVQNTIRWDDARRWPQEKIDGLERYYLAEGDIVVALDRTWVKAGLKAAAVKQADLPCMLVQRVARIRAAGTLDQQFLAAIIQSHRFVEMVKTSKTETAVPHISPNDIREFVIDLPPLPEQRKIAEILRTWDEALEKLTALRSVKVRRISSLRQRLFEAEYASHNRLQRARDLFKTVSERARPDLPLLAVMQDIGIVRRDELDRRVAMPDGDTSTYKVVRPGDFVISLRSFEGGLEFSSITGLVSPAYTVLRPTTDLIGDYYRHFFKSRSFIGRLDKLIFGIRDGKQIAFRDFGDMYIPAPPVAEQEAQARALESLEADLALEDERIAALTRQKRGLMQKLLTGEWRLKLEAPVA